MAEVFEILFAGGIEPGFTRDDVVRNLTILFKAGPEQVERMFSGRPVVLRNNLDLETAHKYETALRKNGATPILRSMASGVTGSASEPAPSEGPSERGSTAAPGGADVSRQTPPPAAGLKLAGERVEAILAGLDWQLAPAGAILDTEAAARVSKELTPVPEWGLAPVGSDLGQAKASASPPPPSTAHLKLVPQPD